MLSEIFGFYLQGLGLSAITAVVLGGLWLLYRAARGLDDSQKQRRRVLYELSLMLLMTIPVMAFAFMAILLMVKS
ncbi:DUF4059 family protein [Streptococcus sp. E17BB]|uniref:DUF4059 family protein n=1 Tax=Streptococcus sp. E17BB TaxID=3278714 RepID=UPI00359E4806